jgi:hypothetical protein
LLLYSLAAGIGLLGQLIDCHLLSTPGVSLSVTLEPNFLLCFVYSLLLLLRSLVECLRFIGLLVIPAKSLSVALELSYLPWFDHALPLMWQYGIGLPGPFLSHPLSSICQHLKGPAIRHTRSIQHDYVCRGRCRMLALVEVDWKGCRKLTRR